MKECLYCMKDKLRKVDFDNRLCTMFLFFSFKGCQGNYSSLLCPYTSSFFVCLKLVDSTIMGGRARNRKCLLANSSYVYPKWIIFIYSKAF